MEEFQRGMVELMAVQVQGATGRPQTTFAEQGEGWPPGVEVTYRVLQPCTLGVCLGLYVHHRHPQATPLLGPLLTTVWPHPDGHQPHGPGHYAVAVTLDTPQFHLTPGDYTIIVVLRAGVQRYDKWGQDRAITFTVTESAPPTFLFAGQVLAAWPGYLPEEQYQVLAACRQLAAHPDVHTLATAIRTGYVPTSTDRKRLETLLEAR